MTKIAPLVINKPSSESLYVSIGYCYGSVNEPDGKHGINHLLEHILVGQIEKYLERIGHQVVCDGFTDTQLLRIDIKTIRKNLDFVVEAIKELLNSDHLDTELFDAEKPAILGASDLTTDPYYRCLELSRQTVFSGSKFSHPPDGYRNEIESISTNDCNNVWKTIRNDYKSVIGFCGNIDHVELDWLSGENYAPDEVWQFNPSQTSVNLGIQGIECCLGTFVACIDPVLIDFLGFIVGGSSHSLLYKALRKDSGFSYDTRSLVDHYSTGSLIRLYFGLDDKANFQKVKSLIWKTLDDFRLDVSLLEFYKEAFKCMLVFESDNPERYLSKSVFRKMIGIEHDPVNIFDKLDRLDTQTVNTAFKEFFSQERFSISTVM